MYADYAKTVLVLTECGFEAEVAGPVLFCGKIRVLAVSYHVVSFSSSASSLQWLE